MAILSIENLRIGDRYCYVEAIIEDVKCIRNQTHLDPPEFGPALCCASFDPSEMDVPADEQEFKKFLEDLCLAWRVIDSSYVDDFEIDCVI
jgi:hypothetical protein